MSLRTVCLLCIGMARAAQLAAQPVQPVSSGQSAEPSYQYYVWGTTVRELERKVPDLERARLYQPGGRFPGLEDALLYFDGGRLGGVVRNPLAADPAEVTAYTSDALMLTFWFSGPGLVAVTFNMQNRHVLADLEKKYGAADEISGTSVGWEFNAAAWRASQMIVSWEELPALSTEFVTYMDNTWFALKEKQALAGSR